MVLQFTFHVLGLYLYTIICGMQRPAATRVIAAAKPMAALVIITDLL
jgi:hypothetical protein